MAGSLRLSDNKFHIAGPATEKAADHNCWDDGEARWEDLDWQSEDVVWRRHWRQTRRDRRGTELSSTRPKNLENRTCTHDVVAPRHISIARHMPRLTTLRGKKKSGKILTELQSNTDCHEFYSPSCSFNCVSNCTENTAYIPLKATPTHFVKFLQNFKTAGYEFSNYDWFSTLITCCCCCCCWW